MKGVIIYGPPASGKDTVTEALRKQFSEYRLYPRLKVGPGRTEGYRMGTPEDLDALRSAGEVIWENYRYGATYVVDRKSLLSMLESEYPVIHLGQAEAIHSVQSAFPAVRWLTVYLWCPREVATARIVQRSTGDTRERLRAWDETEPIEADLSFNTEEVAPEQVAAAIHAELTASEGATRGCKENTPGSSRTPEEAALIADIDADNAEYRTPLAVLAEIAGMSHATLHRRLRAYR